MRIASLLASATEIVYALDLGDQLVAISHECDYPAAALDKPRLSRPRFDPAGLDSGAIDAAVRNAMATHGSVYQVDEDLLRQTRPDLIVAQAVCEVCAVPTSLAEQVSQSLGSRNGAAPRILSLDAHTIDEILESIVAVAQAAGVPERGEERAAQLHRRIDSVKQRLAGTSSKQRVLAIEWLDPPFAPGHWVPEMIEIAGGQNLVGASGTHSQQKQWDDLAGLDPDVLLVMPCGYGLDQSRADADCHAAELKRVAPRAISQGRAFVVDGSSYFNRSGPRVADGIELLARLLHPDRFPDIPIAGRAAPWTPA